MVLLITTTNKPTTEELLKTFTKRGGRVNRYYLQTSNKNKPALVYLHGWYSGKNFREALLKALG